MEPTYLGSTHQAMKRPPIFLFLFLIVSATELLAVAFHWPILNAAAKPCIMLSLIGFYVLGTSSRSSAFILALFFCWAGDVLLLFQAEAELFFIVGLVAFLVGHTLYIVAYRQLQWPGRKHELMPTQKMRFSFPIILAGTGLIVVLFPTLGGLKIPVLVYALVLMLMVMTALFRYGRTPIVSFWMIFAGAALFMISDSLLAINKFYAPIPDGGFFVMLTYCVAQYLIVKGALKHQ